MILWIILIVFAIIILLILWWYNNFIIYSFSYTSNQSNTSNISDISNKTIGFTGSYDHDSIAIPTIHSRCNQNSPCGGDLVCDLNCKRCKKKINGDCSADIDCESGLRCHNWKCSSNSIPIDPLISSLNISSSYISEELIQDERSSPIDIEHSEHRSKEKSVRCNYENNKIYNYTK
jgi:hypothetical protein